MSAVAACTRAAHFFCSPLSHTSVCRANAVSGCARTQASRPTVSLLLAGTICSTGEKERHPTASPGALAPHAFSCLLLPRRCGRHNSGVFENTLPVRGLPERVWTGWNAQIFFLRAALHCLTLRPPRFFVLRPEKKHLQSRCRTKMWCTVNNNESSGDNVLELRSRLRRGHATLACSQSDVHGIFSVC